MVKILNMISTSQNDIKVLKFKRFKIFHRSFFDETETLANKIVESTVGSPIDEFTK